MKLTPTDRQNIFDIAAIGAGTAEAAYEIAYANGKSVSAALVPGTEITVSVVLNKRTVDFYKLRTNKPATSEPTVDGIFDETFSETFE